MPAACLILTVSPHPVAVWFLRPAARPVVLVDGIEHPGAWGKPCTVQLVAGTHEVAAGLRYRGTRAVLGTTPIRVTLAEDETREMVAVNGIANHTPFTITVP